ncbi:PREDICTED: 3-ketoacyl-CoA synthase 21-like [Populus euphratica]|uniref:very-long-chain 3-oxoacyl-CoA synthase n=1 Tax=Populus euphratica TaxID=75702 RepID=A0AAJ6TFP0_POPEU|nr:PREDICTED: 3-ketoacyl-CoA synthase 21-like [Populus euphratica]
MRLIAYWNIVVMRLVDNMALHLQLSIRNFVNKEMEKEIVTNALLGTGGGVAVERMLEEPPSVASKRERLNTSIKLLRESKEAFKDTEDDLGNNGFRFNKDLPKVGAEALTMNLRVLLPKVIPLSELLRYRISYYRNKIMKRPAPTDAGLGLDIKSGIDHFCVHPSGRAVIDDAGQSLAFNDYDLEPARMTLYRFGNTSSGGLWYVLGYMEAKKRLKKGDKILMISLGAGFKCNNCVWKVMKDLEDTNVWKTCIDQYPPKTLANSFSKILASISDESMNFTSLEDYQP